MCLGNDQKSSSDVSLSKSEQFISRFKPLCWLSSLIGLSGTPPRLLSEAQKQIRLLSFLPHTEERDWTSCMFF